MAGHSKWANIQHRKGAQDAKRGKIFTKLVKEISVAVKVGGGPDPDFNPRLRMAVINARSQSMPKDNIERAIKKASGSGGDDYSENTFEGYGPDGVAVFVEGATDNNTRTVANIRMHFNKNGGSLGKDGSLQFMFDHKGVFVLPIQEGQDPDEVMLELIEFGAEDYEVEGNQLTVYTEMTSFGAVQKQLSEMKIDPTEASLQRIPSMFKTLKTDNLATFMKLIDTLEDDDDVQKVYHNADIDEVTLEAYFS